jgi:hypothetical protein
MDPIIPAAFAFFVVLILGYSLTKQNKAVSGMDDGIKMQREVLDLLKKSIQLQEDSLKTINEIKLIKQMEVGRGRENRTPKS